MLEKLIENNLIFTYNYGSTVTYRVNIATLYKLYEQNINDLHRIGDSEVEYAFKSAMNYIKRDVLKSNYLLNKDTFYEDLNDLKSFQVDSKLLAFNLYKLIDRFNWVTTYEGAEFWSSKRIKFSGIKLDFVLKLIKKQIYPDE